MVTDIKLKQKLIHRVLCNDILKRLQQWFYEKLCLRPVITRKGYRCQLSKANLSLPASDVLQFLTTPLFCLQTVCTCSCTATARTATSKDRPRPRSPCSISSALRVVSNWAPDVHQWAPVNQHVILNGIKWWKLKLINLIILKRLSKNDNNV